MKNNISDTLLTKIYGDHTLRELKVMTNGDRQRVKFTFDEVYELLDYFPTLFPKLCKEFEQKLKDETVRKKVIASMYECELRPEIREIVLQKIKLVIAQP